MFAALIGDQLRSSRVIEDGGQRAVVRILGEGRIGSREASATSIEIGAHARRTNKSKPVSRVVNKQEIIGGSGGADIRGKL